MLLYRNEPQKRSVKNANKQKSLWKKITALMESNENVNLVNFELAKLIQCCQDANGLHESLINLPLAQDEIKRQ